LDVKTLVFFWSYLTFSPQKSRGKSDFEVSHPTLIAATGFTLSPGRCFGQSRVFVGSGGWRAGQRGSFFW